MPPSDMMAPARTKNGMVSIATLDTPSEILSITASSGTPIQSPPAMAARPSEYAIGMPRAKNRNKLPRRTAMSMALQGPARYSKAGAECAPGRARGGPSVRCSTTNRNRIAPPTGIGR